MANNGTDDVSLPGNDWRMSWRRGGLRNLQLDVVGFLAILGEDAIKKTSHLASLSWTFLLPCLIPAPHSLIFTERSKEESILAKVSSMAGNHRNSLAYPGAVMFEPGSKYEARCFDIHWREPISEEVSRLKARPAAPVVLANLFGSTLSLALLALSCLFGNLASLVATVLLSSLSVLVGMTNYWTCALTYKCPRIPDTSIVVAWPNHSFLVVKTSDEIAAFLFFWSENKHYYLEAQAAFMAMSLCGTLFLIFSVIALANAMVELQIAWAGSYVLLNLSHWAAAALPGKDSFDFPQSTIEEQGLANGPYNDSYTEALWKAILLTKSTHWVKEGIYLPNNEKWNAWTEEAGMQAEHCGRFDGYLRNPLGRARTVEGVIWEEPGYWNHREAFDRIFKPAGNGTGGA